MNAQEIENEALVRALADIDRLQKNDSKLYPDLVWTCAREFFDWWCDKLRANS